MNATDIASVFGGLANSDVPQCFQLIVKKYDMNSVETRTITTGALVKRRNADRACGRHLGKNLQNGVKPST